MSSNRLSRALVVTTLALFPLIFVSTARAQWVVEDPTNAVLQIQQLIREAQEIDNQIQQIQNQVQSLQNESKMLQHLSVSNAQQALDAMEQIQQALRQFCIELQVQGASDHIGFESGYNCGLIAQQLRALFPSAEDWHAQPDPQIHQFPDQWASQARASAAKAVQVQDASVANMDATQERMNELASASRSAPGQTAATQVTNEMLVTVSAQLRDQQATELATQRTIALQQSQDAAEYERNKELVARATRDANTSYDVPPVTGPFPQAGN